MTGIPADHFADAEFEQLQQTRPLLAAKLREAARELCASGRPVSLGLLDDSHRFQQRLQAMAQHFGLATSSPVSGRLSLSQIQEFQERQLQRIQARQLLVQLQSLKHVELPAYEPLIHCQQLAARLLEGLNGPSQGDWLDVEITDLAQNRHPLLAVLELATQRDDLSDEEWASRHDRVAEMYGLPLATALARGRIILNVADLPDDLPVSSQPNELTPTITGENSNAANEIEDLIFDTPAPPPRRWSIIPEMIAEVPQPNPPTTTEPISDRPVVSEAAETALSVVPDTQPLNLTPEPPLASPSSQEAHVAHELAPTSANQLDDISSSVMKLIREERYALAFHLVEAGDTDLMSRCPVSAPLLRACALSRHISYPRGDLATQLDLELRRLPPIPAPTFGEQDRIGVGLLVRAACLPAALLGASPAATTLLRSFPIEPGTSQLYNFCARVAAFGERMQGFAAEMFQATADESSWRSDADQLHDDISLWWAQLASRTVTYQRSTPLYVHAHWTVTTRPAQRQPEVLNRWLTWQNVLAHIDQVLRPIRLHDHGDRQRVKPEVLKLMSWLESPATINEPRLPLELTDLQKNVVREALELAHRWLRLEASTPQKSRVLPSEAQSELLADLRQRIPAVLTELDQIALNCGQPWVITGAVACRHMVEYLQRLCAGQLTLALEEPPLNEALNAILLKIPHLELDPQWNPLLDPRDNLPQLLAAVHDEEITWRDAFELQCQQGDHLATQRLLELPVWTSEERESLQHLRSQRLEQCRQKAHASLSDLIDQIQSAVDSQKITARESETWTERADRLLIMIPRTVTFSRLWSQIEALRAMWQREPSQESPQTAKLSPSSPRWKPNTPQFLEEVTSNKDPNTTDPSESAEWVF